MDDTVDLEVTLTVNPTEVGGCSERIGHAHSFQIRVQLHVLVHGEPRQGDGHATVCHPYFVGVPIKVSLQRGESVVPERDYDIHGDEAVVVGQFDNFGTYGPQGRVK